MSGSTRRKDSQQGSTQSSTDCSAWTKCPTCGEMTVMHYTRSKGRTSVETCVAGIINGGKHCPFIKITKLK
jgi:ribosomal protein L32